MSDNFMNLLLLGSFFLALFGAAEMLYRFAKVKAEHTRKFVHIGTGLLTLLFPGMFTHYVWVIGICTLFFVLLFISQRLDWLPSINAISRESYGSLSYPVVVILAFVFYYVKTSDEHPHYFYFYIPILTMALADPAAALFGSRFPFGKYKTGKERKTIAGSFAFFIVAGLVNFLLLPRPELLFIIFTPLAATLAEAFTGKGLDNLTVPLSVIAVLNFYPCL